MERPDGARISSLPENENARFPADRWFGRFQQVVDDGFDPDRPNVTGELAASERRIPNHAEGHSQAGEI